MTEDRDSQTVRIELETPDWQFQSALTIPTAPMTIGDWLPFLRTLANKAAEISEEKAQAAGKSISCKKGCGACCRQLVAISLAEARALSQLVEAMPEPRRSDIRARFSDAVRRAEKSGVLEREIEGATADDPDAVAAAREALGRDYFRQQIACPFLEAESCSIHAERPLVCREYLVTSPAPICARLYREPVEPVPLNVHLGEALARATAKIYDIPNASIPLIFALQ